MFCGGASGPPGAAYPGGGLLVIPLILECTPPSGHVPRRKIPEEMPLMDSIKPRPRRIDYPPAAFPGR